jgi:hypothetical protein
MITQTDILALLKDGLNTASLERSQATLGDRRDYLGMSDLARGMSCPRAVVAGKLADNSADLSLETLLTLERGHWLEFGIEEALRAVKQQFLSQLEINVIHDATPIKAHLDLVLVSPDGSDVTVLELKSMGTIKDSVMPSHEAQLKGQVSLLHEYWNQPVFTVDKCQTPLSFPNLVRHLMGINLENDPDNLELSGFVLTVSPNSAKAFGSYKPERIFLTTLLETGSNLWKAINMIQEGGISLDALEIEEGFSPLCDYCRFNRDCPKFQSDTELNLENELAALAELKAQKNRLEEDIQEREGQLKTVASLMDKFGQWINSGAHRFKVINQNGRLTLDQSLLKRNLIELGCLKEDVLHDILAASQKEGKLFQRLFVSPIN